LHDAAMARATAIDRVNVTDAGSLLDFIRNVVADSWVNSLFGNAAVASGVAAARGRWAARRARRPAMAATDIGFGCLRHVRRNIISAMTTGT
jgi:hypothetical protein